MIRLALLVFGLFWLARTYAATTPITDLGIARIPATTALVVVLVLAVLAGILRRMCRDTPARPRATRDGRATRATRDGRAAD